MRTEAEEEVHIKKWR